MSFMSPPHFRCRCCLFSAFDVVYYSEPELMHSAAQVLHLEKGSVIQPHTDCPTLRSAEQQAATRAMLSNRAQ